MAGQRTVVARFRAVARGTRVATLAVMANVHGPQKSSQLPAARASIARMSELPPRAELYAQLEALPENQVGEIVDGVLYASPRPAIPHAKGTSQLLGSLMGPFDRGVGGPGGWLLLVEPEWWTGENVVVPDIAGWRRERMPHDPTGAYVELAPDWLCEVLSPSTARLDRTRKLPLYARTGVAHVWLVDPLARSLEVLALDGATYRLVASAGADEAGRFVPFEAIELELVHLWTR